MIQVVIGEVRESWVGKVPVSSYTVKDPDTIIGLVCSIRVKYPKEEFDTNLPSTMQ